MREPIHSKGRDLYIKFELIGYKNSGESIIITIVDDIEKILWCGVIDCYCYNSINITKDVLNNYGFGDKKRKINFLCISHPDKDHIYELDEIINEYTDDNTMFSLPDFFNSNLKQTEEIKCITECLNKCFNYSKRSDSKKNNLFFNKKMAETQLRWKFVVGTSEFVLQIESLTPSDSIIQASRKLDYSSFKNDFSISLKISLNEYIYLLMGDSSELSLNNLDEEDFYGNTNYLKIPHHGDKNRVMEDMVRNKVIDNLDTTACTYRKNTTLQDTLEFYNEYSNIVSLTGDINTEKNIYDYGIVTHVYEIQTGELVTEKSNQEKNGILNYFNKLQ